MSLLPLLSLVAVLAQAPPPDAPIGDASFGHDYEAHHQGWNGLSEFTRLAGELGCPVASRAVLDWEALDGRDVLLLLYPETPVPERELLGFLSAGGRAVVADDYGRADAALRALRIERKTALPKGLSYYRDNQALPMAAPLRRTALSGGAGELVANHPAAFSGPLPPTYAFVPAGPAAGQVAGLVIEGSFGRGRFVALSDPSLLINNMMKISGNQEFAARLIADLCRPGRDRFLLFHGPFATRGVPAAVLPGAPSSGGLDDAPDRMNRALSGANLHIQETLSRDRLWIGLDAASLTGLALTIAVLLLLLRYLPLSPVAHDVAFARPAHKSETGLLSTLLRHVRGDVPWGHAFPVLLLREEVMRRLSPCLSELSAEFSAESRAASPSAAGAPAVAPALSAGEVDRAMSARFGKTAGRSAAILWRELLPARESTAASRVSARRLRRLYELAVVLFAEMEGKRNPVVRLKNPS